MMKEEKIKKDKIADFIKAAANKYNLFGPVKSEDHHLFAQVSSAGEMDLGYTYSLLSPKGLFFPQSEVLYRYENNQVAEEKFPEKKRVVMFVRPCDARALTFLDNVFDDEQFQDPYYLERRKRTTVISLACNHPLNTCFCAALESGPADEKGSDIIFFDTGDDFIIKVITPKGEDFIKPFEKLLSQAQKADMDKVKKLTEESQKKINSQLTTRGLKEKLDGAFDGPFWDKIHQKCLGCGTCTYLCPTCYCFDITDEVCGTKGKRLRSWDSCMYPLFTLHASEHNPRPSGKERVRQRIMHKFNYCPENFKASFCVGCGRCVRKCPVNLDIRGVIDIIQSEK